MILAKLVFLIGAEEPQGRLAMEALRSGGARLVVLERSDDLREATQLHGAPDVVYVAVSCAPLPAVSEPLALRDYCRVNDERLQLCYRTICAAAQVMRRGTVLVAAAPSLGRAGAFLEDERALWARVTGRAAFTELVLAAEEVLAPAGIHVKLLWKENG